MECSAQRAGLFSRVLARFARGSRGAAKRPSVDGCRESEISLRVIQRQDADQGGLGGAWRLRPEWRWIGHDGPPWFGAGGAGKLQALRVIDRRNGLMTLDGSMPARHEPGGMQREARSGPPLPRWCGYYRTHLAISAKRRDLRYQSSV
jgi:hypothetical protein